MNGEFIKDLLFEYSRNDKNKTYFTHFSTAIVLLMNLEYNERQTVD